ncbi:hypothetical protein ACFWRV_26160 [Streptomyces sp. NPDC058576]|uniref:hypothetical protein n=1 Tax=Streptomyces sp. NPDC058576 TaxID=3346547 RepID=UPI0036538F3F
MSDINKPTISPKPLDDHMSGGDKGVVGPQDDHMSGADKNVAKPQDDHMSGEKP